MRAMWSGKRIASLQVRTTVTNLARGKGLTMALKKLRMICAGGDKTLAEWDTETVSQQRLTEIEKEFNEKIAQGWFAADISEKKDVLIREFDPNAEILLIPRVQGGL